MFSRAGQISVLFYKRRSLVLPEFPASTNALALAVVPGAALPSAFSATVLPRRPRWRSPSSPPPGTGRRYSSSGPRRRSRTAPPRRPPRCRPGTGPGVVHPGGHGHDALPVSQGALARGILPVATTVPSVRPVWLSPAATATMSVSPPRCTGRTACPRRPVPSSRRPGVVLPAAMTMSFNPLPGTGRTGRPRRPDGRPPGGQPCAGARRPPSPDLLPGEQLVRGSLKPHRSQNFAWSRRTSPQLGQILSTFVPHITKPGPGPQFHPAGFALGHGKFLLAVTFASIIRDWPGENNPAEKRKFSIYIMYMRGRIPRRGCGSGQNTSRFLGPRGGFLRNFHSLPFCKSRLPFCYRDGHLTNGISAIVPPGRILLTLRPAQIPQRHATSMCAGQG